MDPVQRQVSAVAVVSCPAANGFGADRACLAVPRSYIEHPVQGVARCHQPGHGPVPRYCAAVRERSIRGAVFRIHQRAIDGGVGLATVRSVFERHPDRGVQPDPVETAAAVSWSPDHQRCDLLGGHGADHLGVFLFRPAWNGTASATLRWCRCAQPDCSISRRTPRSVRRIGSARCRRPAADSTVRYGRLDTRRTDVGQAKRHPDDRMGSSALPVKNRPDHPGRHRADRARSGWSKKTSAVRHPAPPWLRASSIGSNMLLASGFEGGLNRSRCVSGVFSNAGVITPTGRTCRHGIRPWTRSTRHEGGGRVQRTGGRTYRRATRRAQYHIFGVDGANIEGPVRRRRFDRITTVLAKHEFSAADGRHAAGADPRSGWPRPRAGGCLNLVPGLGGEPGAGALALVGRAPDDRWSGQLPGSSGSQRSTRRGSPVRCRVGVLPALPPAAIPRRTAGRSRQLVCGGPTVLFVTGTFSGP